MSPFLNLAHCPKCCWMEGFMSSGYQQTKETLNSIIQWCVIGCTSQDWPIRAKDQNCSRNFSVTGLCKNCRVHAKVLEMLTYEDLDSRYFRHTIACSHWISWLLWEACRCWISWGWQTSQHKKHKMLMMTLFQSRCFSFHLYLWLGGISQ